MAARLGIAAEWDREPGLRGRLWRMTFAELAREHEAREQAEKGVWLRHAVSVGAWGGTPPEQLYPDLFGPSGRWPVVKPSARAEPLTAENVAERARRALQRAGHLPS